MLRRGVLALVLLTSACGAEGTADDATGGQVVVLAASSMREAMAAIGADFEDSHPGADIVLTADGSSGLAAAIIEGAPGDVFVAADATTMERVQRAGRVDGSARELAHNDVQLAVAAGNPLGIRGVADLDGVVVSLCRSEVPCGAYAEAVFAKAGVAVPDAGREPNVSAVVTKIQLGEADAGLVYRTDVLAATGLTGLDLSPPEGVTARYQVAILAGGPNPGGAREFLAFLSGRQARARLLAAGFRLP